MNSVHLSGKTFPWLSEKEDGLLAKNWAAIPVRYIIVQISVGNWTEKSDRWLKHLEAYSIEIM